MAELYAIVGGMERARFMLENGAPYLQLRFKDEPLAPHRDEVAQWPSRYPSTRLIVNDDLEFALTVGAWGVHLGQGDLKGHDPARLWSAPLRVGISTHDQGEIDGALRAGAAMIGFGPVFPTGSKAMTHAPQGPARLARIVETVPVPVVAIGGIGEENLERVAATNVAMIAMIAYLDQITTGAQMRRLIARLGGKSAPGSAER